MVSPSIRGRLHVLDSADDLAALRAFGSRFAVGQPLRCRVLASSGGGDKGLDLTLRAPQEAKVSGRP